MTKIKELSQMIEKEDKKQKSNSDYNDLRIFLKNVRESGLALKKEYSIPQTDTIGKRYTPQATHKLKD